LPRYSPDTKTAASAGQEAAEWTRSICGVAGLESHPRYLYAAAFFDLLARVAGRIVADPPRKDFGVSTRLRSRFATPHLIATEDRRERLALEAAEAADTAEAYLAAHLRAFERLQGAEQASDRAAAAEREGESVRLAHMSGQALRDLSRLVAEISEGVPSSPDRDPERRRGRPQLGEVDREALATLFLGGLRLRDLENVLRGTRLEAAVGAPERLVAAAGSFRRFGDTMTGWTPPRESEPHLGGAQGPQADPERE
jgi:hypothetical protein